MKRFCCAFLLICALAYSFADECPAGEANPGPECGLEPSCAPRSSHFIPKHTCDCWCIPGTLRDPYSNKCVKDCNNIFPPGNY